MSPSVVPTGPAPAGTEDLVDLHSHTSLNVGRQTAFNWEVAGNVAGNQRGEMTPPVALQTSH